MVKRQFPLALCFPLGKNNPGRPQPKHFNQVIMRAAPRSHKLHIGRYGVQSLYPERQGFRVTIHDKLRVLLCEHEPSIEVRLIVKVAALVKAHQLNLFLPRKRLLNQVCHADSRTRSFEQFKVIPSAFANRRKEAFGPRRITANFSVRTIRNLARFPIARATASLGERASVPRREREDCSVVFQLGIAMLEV